jgi:hypothetical protein
MHLAPIDWPWASAIRKTPGRIAGVAAKIAEDSPMTWELTQKFSE